MGMAITEPVVKAMQEAEENVPAVLRAFMNAEGMNQADLGAVVGLDQRQVSYRMLRPGSITPIELAGWAQHFGVEISTLFKPKREALRDLYAGEPKPSLLSSTRHAA